MKKKQFILEILTTSIFIYAAFIKKNKINTIIIEKPIKKTFTHPMINKIKDILFT